MDHSSRSMKMLHLAISRNYAKAGNSTNSITKCDDEQAEQYFMNSTVPSSQPKEDNIDTVFNEAIPVKYPAHSSLELEARDSTKYSEHVECSFMISTVSSSPAKDESLYSVL